MTDVTQGEQDASSANAAAAENAAAQEQRAPQQNGAANGGGNGQQASNGNGTLATGAETAEAEVKSYWPADWREKIAEHASAGDKKAYEKELRRLQNMENPYSVYGSFRTLENTWASRNFIKMPPKENARPEEVAEFHKSLGVPETPEGYFENIKLENGAVLGDADKPIAEDFAKALHPAGATPAVVSKALNWYLARQEQQAADLDQADETYRIESERALKEEYGPAFKRKTNAIASLFDIAPGGVDINNERALYSRLMGGRTADGKVIGNDPDMVRFLVALAMDRNPSATVVDEAGASGKTVDGEISEIENIMRTDRRRYDKEFAGRYAELLTVREKIRARAR